MQNCKKKKKISSKCHRDKLEGGKVINFLELCLVGEWKIKAFDGEAKRKISIKN